MVVKYWLYFVFSGKRKALQSESFCECLPVKGCVLYLTANDYSKRFSVNSSINAFQWKDVFNTSDLPLQYRTKSKYFACEEEMYVHSFEPHNSLFRIRVCLICVSPYTYTTSKQKSANLFRARVQLDADENLQFSHPGLPATLCNPLQRAMNDGNVSAPSAESTHWW